MLINLPTQSGIVTTILKTLIFGLATMFAMSNFASAGTAVPAAAGFPSEKTADCNATMLLSAEGAPIAYRSVCTAADMDGDLLVATIGATKPDFSDCAWTAHGGTGKYAGVTGGGQCAPAGNLTKDGNSSKSTWTGEWILP
jgi:hypothetical protein